MKFNLKIGDTIGICSPSGPYSEKDIRPTIKYLKMLGFKTKLSKNIFSRDRYLAGIPKQRINDIHQLFCDKSVDAIIAGRGGFGSIQLLDQLDFALIKENSKPFFGFSDTTALQLALYKKIRLPSITGITLTYDIKKDKVNKTTINNFEQLIFQHSFPKIILTNQSKQKNADGILIGGCLSLITSLMGTSYFPELKDKILFIEDVNEEPYNIDRLLSQLLMAKNFSKLSAIVIGNFYKCNAEDKKHGSIKQVINSFIDRSNKTVFTNLPYGHQPSRILLPIGLPAKIIKNELIIL
ncbi:MAG: LD-carboxypeptidase [Planctomycetota bacterium]|nr:MAG: LD-carboxypeptidase [Planctomycetota bacterium]